MRSPHRLLITTLLVLSVACQKAHHDETRIAVLFTTDEHSHLFAVAPEVDDFDLAKGTIVTAPGTGALQGGVARRAAILETERQRARSRGVQSLTVSAGDFTQGALSAAALLQTAPDLVLLKRMGYDAVALGNHEFDVGPGGLALAISKATRDQAPELPPLVLTNAIFSDADTPLGHSDDRLAALYGPGNVIAPSRVVNLSGGAKVGIVAWMGVSAGTDAAGAAPVRFWSETATTASARLADIAARVQPVIDALRASDHVDAVVVLGHGGIGATSSETGDDEKLAATISGVDLVVSGHSHRSPGAPRVVMDKDGRPVPVVQAGPFGSQVGRVELVITDGGRPTLDAAETAFIPVDDRTIPTTDGQVLRELAGTIDTIEGSFLEPWFAAIGVPAVHAARGDLYYRKLGHTRFDVRGLGGGESNAMNLDTDAMLASARQVGGPTTVALQNYGAIRTDLLAGKTGDLSFADVYRVVPNGLDPGDLTPGYPLVRLAISTVELRLALEGTLLQSMLDGDYFVSASGLRVEYDKSRPMFDVAAAAANPFTPGWVTRMALTDDAGIETALLYDATQDGVTLPGVGATHFLVNPATSLQPMVATLYVAGFASAFGVTLRDPATGAPLASIYDAVLRRADGSAVKDHQSLAGYVYAECEANGGELPSRYDASVAEGAVPRRMVCGGPICP